MVIIDFEEYAAARRAHSELLFTACRIIRLPFPILEERPQGRIFTPDDFAACPPSPDAEPLRTGRQPCPQALAAKQVAA